MQTADLSGRVAIVTGGMCMCACVHVCVCVGGFGGVFVFFAFAITVLIYQLIVLFPFKYPFS